MDSWLLFRASLLSHLLYRHSYLGKLSASGLSPPCKKELPWLTEANSPKLLVHIFIGSRLAILVEKGEDMSIGDKMVNWLSIIIGAGVGIFVGLIIYRRTMARAAEIAREEARDANTEEGEAGYEDADGTLMDPEDAAALMSDDDMSMWDTQVESAYRDDEGSSDGDSQKKKTKKQDIEEDDPPNWGETSDRK